jgi:Tat protein translocase TatB subunit
MFGSIGGAEILMILVVALLLFGPRKLPGIGKTIGRTLAEFRRATNDFKSSLEQEVEISDIKKARSGLDSISRELTGEAEAARPDHDASDKPKS